MPKTIITFYLVKIKYCNNVNAFKTYQSIRYSIRKEFTSLTFPYDLEVHRTARKDKFTSNSERI